MRSSAYSGGTDWLDRVMRVCIEGLPCLVRVNELWSGGGGTHKIQNLKIAWSAGE